MDTILKKKIVVLSTGDINGAYEAAYRIAKFAKDAGFEVAMLVKHKTKSDSFIVQIYPEPQHIISKFGTIFIRAMKKLRVYSLFSSSKPTTEPKYLFLDDDETAKCVSGERLMTFIDFNPDLIIVGMTNGFTNTNTLAELKQLTNAKIFWVTVDMIPFTGGCHYAWGCEGYQTDCKNCPAILETRHKNWPHQNLMIKQKNISQSDIQVLAGSGWTLHQARNSMLFKNQPEIFNINSCIDTGLFNNRHRKYAKAIFNLPAGCKVIFAGSQNTKDERKGTSYFIEALNILWETATAEMRENTYVLIASRDNKEDKAIETQILFKKHLIEYMKDYRLLALAYQAADVFVCASIEDAGPMMVSEALACGTPVVGFEMGVVINMVEDGYNGFKAELKNSKKLAEGIGNILKLNNEEFNIYSLNAVNQVEKFSSQHTVINTINKILNT